MPATPNKKFKVIDTTTGEEVVDSFVLLPMVDSAARTALAAYCEATRNAKVSRFLRLWLHAIHDGRAKKGRSDPDETAGNVRSDAEPGVWSL
jgi:hypothetical protein